MSLFPKTSQLISTIAGESLTVFSTFDNIQPKVHFFVDGGAQDTVVPARSSSTTQFQVPLYTASSLDPTASHTLQINILDAGPFTLDYVLIGNGEFEIFRVIEPYVFPNRARFFTELGASSTNSPIQTIGSTNPLPLSPSSATSVPSFPSSTTTPSRTNSSLAYSGTSDGNSPSPSDAAGVTSNSGMEATIIGAVAGSVSFLAVVIIGLFVFLRRRRRASPSLPPRSSPSKKLPSEWADVRPPSRPSLHLSIPNALNLSRGLQKTGSLSLLPTYNKSTASSSRNSLLHSSGTGSSSDRPKASFLEDDPIEYESPIFDIKQRPVSGSTMTTRVTVGTSVGQRASVPDSAYHQYHFSEHNVPVPVPPVPVLPQLVFLQTKPNSHSNDMSCDDESRSMPTTLSASALAYLSSGMMSRTNTTPTSVLPSNTDRMGSATEILPGTTSYETGTGTGTGTGFSAPRPLPHTPIQMKRGLSDSDEKRESDVRRTGGGQEGGEISRKLTLPGRQNQYSALENDDAGARGGGLDYSSPQSSASVKRSPPPPYQNFNQ